MKKNYKLWAFVLALSLLFAFLPLLSAPAVAQGESRVVRVGWFETPFNRTDDYGRRSGYAYEYQQKIAAYTGWTYEYVYKSWPDLLDDLIAGDIDLLADVSYTEERADKMLFSSLPMGAEEYYIYIAPNNESITADDYSSFNGKIVGMNKGSVQVGFFTEWMHANNVTAEIRELTEDEKDAVELLDRGEIDAYVSLDSFRDDVNKVVPVCKIGSSNFYFAVSNSQHELLNELNVAMNRIYEENHYYNEQLYFKYLRTSGSNYYLSSEEKAWVEEHNSTIRVGYQDNYLAFCAKDPQTGELTGALKDYLEMASTCLENAQLKFEAICYPTAAAAMEAVKKGEVDCMFPANLSLYDGEEQGFLMTATIMRTDISAIVAESEQKGFFTKDHITVAVNKGNTNYNLFLVDNFPEWRAVYFNDTPEGLQAISEGKVDCLLMSNYRVNNIATLCKKYHLVSLSTGVEIDYSFAVARNNTVLYSILNKIEGVIPDAAVNAALSYYFTEDAKVGFGELITQNFGYIMLVFALIALVILALIFINVRAEKNARKRQTLIAATEADALTGLYSKNYFFEYANRMYQKDPEKPMDAIALDIENFHSVNALNGTAFGNLVLRELGEELKTFLKEKEGIACRTDADHFYVYCAHFENWHELFDRLQGKLDQLSKKASIRLRMGVMPWQKEVEPRRLFDHALTARNLARNSYKGHLVIFDEKMREKELYEQRLINDLRRAIEEKEFTVYYQPKYDIRVTPAKLVGMEALVRWQHPELGMIPPSDFINLFERNGQIGAVDQFVRTEAIAQAARWKKKYGLTVPVSINLSRMDLLDSSLCNSIDKLVTENGLDRSELRFEVTESAYIENDARFIDVIDSLRDRGYKIEMDDFGSGYSSLNMLSSMPIDVLKMDRIFIRNIDHAEKDVQMVDLILEIAKNLKIPVIAEGVETEAQLNLLKKLGCEMVQGFYFSRPLPAEELEEKILNSEFQKAV